MTGLTDFIERRKAGWERLAAILANAGSDYGLRRLSPHDLRALGPLYRRAAADLAYARLRGADETVIAYLNDIVTRAHGVLYADKNPGGQRLLRFLSVGFPRLVRKRAAYIWAATAMCFLGALLAAGLVAVNPENVRIVVPGQFVDNNKYYQEREANPDYDNPDATKPFFSAFLMQNNIRVAIMSFAMGILGGVPTLLVMFYNGMPLGGLGMQQHQAGRDLLFWSVILPHGIIELTAILIAGASGMMIGHALLQPGELSRKDAIALAGRDAVRLLIGTVPFFLVAGIIESFVTPTALPVYAKLLFGACTAVGLWAYFNAGRETPAAPVGVAGAAA